MMPFDRPSATRDWAGCDNKTVCKNGARILGRESGTSTLSLNATPKFSTVCPEQKPTGPQASGNEPEGTDLAARHTALAIQAKSRPKGGTR